MRRARIVQISAIALVCSAIALRPAGAEDTKGKWQLGFGLSYYSTIDYIRSNSDIAIASSVAGDTSGLPGVTSVDDRPDENMLNQPSIRDNFKLDFNASYGLTRWLALEVQAGYMKSDVGNIEFYIDNKTVAYGGDGPTPGATLCGPDGKQQCYLYQKNDTGSVKSNTFLPVGTITEVPLMLSGLVRFRPESPLDPYVGAGFGYVYASLTTGSEFNSRAAEVEGLHVTAASEGEFTDSGRADKTSAEPGFTPGPLQATVNSGFEYHIVGGVDYYINDHISMYVDARYVWSNTEINITTDGAHQVRFAASDPGKLQLLSVGTASQPNLWEDQGLTLNGGAPVSGVCPTCAGDGLYATTDGNGNGSLDTGLGEGSTLYFFPAGPDPSNPTGNGIWTNPAEAVKVQPCAVAACTSTVLTEDENGNGIMDRYLLYGVDVCTLPNAASNPICRPADFRPSVQYVWPEGCSLTAPSRPTVQPEGCPKSPSTAADISNTGLDDESDIYLIQGGQIHLGAFSIGVGMKFTF